MAKMIQNPGQISKIDTEICVFGSRFSFVVTISTSESSLVTIFDSILGQNVEFLDVEAK